jgi:hypothetical protein
MSVEKFKTGNIAVSGKMQNKVPAFNIARTLAKAMGAAGMTNAQIKDAMNRGNEFES